MNSGVYIWVCMTSFSMPRIPPSFNYIWTTPGSKKGIFSIKMDGLHSWETGFGLLCTFRVSSYYVESKCHAYPNMKLPYRNIYSPPRRNLMNMHVPTMRKHFRLISGIYTSSWRAPQTRPPLTGNAHTRFSTDLPKWDLLPAGLDGVQNATAMEGHTRGFILNTFC